MPKKLLRMLDIDKRFPGVIALNKARFELESGEVVGLMGENGAGKSTLMNVLGGIYKPDGGKIYIDEEEVSIANVLDAQSKGIAFIHQELALEQHMTVAENIFLGRERKNAFHFVSRKMMNDEAQQYLDIVGLKVRPSDKVSRLSTGQQQMLEIAKAFSLKSKIIVMDEPTSSLSEKEVTILFDTIRDLKRRGIGIVYISHKMQEIFDLTDKVVVMRDGCYIDTRLTSETTSAELVGMMVGRELDSYYMRTFNEPGDVVLEAHNISSGKRVKNCSFTLRNGEILGFYGLVGAGRSELMQTIMGLDPMTDGNIVINGTVLSKPQPIRMQMQKLALVPESRKTQGLILKDSITTNVTLPILHLFISKLRVNHKKETELANHAVSEFNIKTPSIKQKVLNLSGGNQQKAVLAKWILTDPKILIMDEPTRGIDVGAKAEIYAIMNEFVKHDRAIIMVSSELNEIINMCDRLCIMCDGAIIATVDRKDFEQDKVLHYALGGME
ncbi:MAG: sugar ABC transporter ATP-binding protein [Clostridia bacterium]